MEQILRGEQDPYVFHMHCTKNKAEKLEFLQQLGEWYVEKECIGATAEDTAGKKAHQDLAELCCAVDVIIKCHYSNTPSKSDCKDSSPF